MEMYPEPLSAKYKESFAYKTIKDRLPVILTKVIDLLFRERIEIVKRYGDESREDIKVVIGRLSKLRNEMQTNKPIIMIQSKGIDARTWNDYLLNQIATVEKSPMWFESAWLYVECYLYRRIRESFELSPCMSAFDPFGKQKRDALNSSLDSILHLTVNLKKSFRICQEEESAIESNVHKFIEVALWGNKSDLSLTAGEHIRSSHQIDVLKDKILVNESHVVWDILKKAPLARLDVVLDNAGYELFTDLCLVEFLQHTKLVSTVKFHVKMMPWFVSDVTIEDFEYTIDTLCENYNVHVVNLAKSWKEKLSTGQWLIKSHPFWTLPHDFSQMEETSPDLYHELKKADLIIFKGDLNYRKLVGDLKWESTTPLKTAVRGFLPSAMCALRTMKADVAVGFAPGHADRMEIVHPDWMTTGNYATIQCLDPTQACKKNE